MDTTGELVIARGKGRLQWLVISSLLCVAVGFWLLRMATGTEAAEGAGSAGGTRFAAWVSILVCGFCGYWAWRRLRDQRPGLTLTRDGLTDRSNITSVGFVPWSDVRDVQGMLVNKHRMILLQLHDPAPYLEKGSALQRMLRRANFRASGTPVVIAAHALQMPANQIEMAIRAYRSPEATPDAAVEAETPPVQSESAAP